MQCTNQISINDFKKGLVLCLKKLAKPAYQKKVPFNIKMFD